MTTKLQLAQQLFSKQIKKLDATELSSLKKWLMGLPFYSRAYNTDPLLFDEMVRLTDQVAVNGEQLLAQEQSVEFLLVLSGTVQVIRRVYVSPSKKKRKQQLEAKEQSIGVLKEGEYRESLGECRLLSGKDSVAKVVYVSLRTRDKVMKELTSRKTNQKMETIMSLSLFEYLDKDLIKKLAEKAVYHVFFLNNYIYRINDSVQSGCFVLLEGSVKIMKHQMVTELWNPPFRSLKIDMSILSPIQIFGEEELLGANQSKRRLYSVMCITETVRLLEIPKDQFVGVMQSHFKNSGGDDIKKFEMGRENLRNSIFIRNKQLLKKANQSEFPSILEKPLPMLKPRTKQAGDTSVLDMRQSTEKDKFSQQRQYKLFRNAHMILQALPSRKKESGVVRSTSSIGSHTDLQQAGSPREASSLLRLPRLSSNL